MSAVAGQRAARAGSRARSLAPVKLWAAAGGVMLAVELVFLVKWLAGASFTPVHSGPGSPPGWMQAALIALQALLVVATAFAFYRFLIRPWRQERRITTDGLLCIAWLLASPWDMLSDYGHYWFTYNSYLVNFGSVMGGLPGVSQPHAAGVNEAFPILLVPGAYVGIFIWLSIAGCAVMRAAKRRRPAFGTMRLVAVCFGFMVLADIVIEGLLFMPLGAWAYGGGQWAINAGHYFKYPLHEMVCGAAVFTSFTCLRYFVDDRGRTIAERGVDRIATTPPRANLLRGLAVLAAVHLGFLLTYHLPQGILSSSATAWPRDVQTRSYFTNGICGPQLRVACPGSE